MIKSRLAVLMAEHPDGPLKMVDIVKATGIRPNTVSDLFHSRMKRIDVNALEDLCEFFVCQPGDLFVREK